MAEYTPVTVEWLDDLLGLPSPALRLDFLRAADLGQAEGLSRLLEHAMRLARSDPGKARQIAVICAEAAGPADAPAILPRAAYLRAQTHAINGEFRDALELIQFARETYEALGERLEALRTNIGRIHALNELGRHAEALEAGQAVLDALGDPAEPEPQVRLLLALAHQNRGACFETIGRYEDALESYARAEAHFAALQMVERIGEVINNRGIVLVHLGRVGEALEALETAARIWADAGMSLSQAQTLTNLADAHLLLGNYTRSLSAFEQARRLLDPLDAAANKGILLRKTADAYLALNLHPEAIALYRQALPLLRDAGMADHRARALWGLGAALAASPSPWPPPSPDASTDRVNPGASSSGDGGGGGVGAASLTLAEAAALFEAAGNTPMRCSVMLEQAALQAAQGAREPALQTARAGLALVEGDAWPVQHLYASMRLADLLLPDASAAEPHLLDARRLGESLNLPVADHRIHSRLGHLRRLQGRDDEARAHLETALSQIEALRGHLALEALRTSFLRDKTSAYEDLLLLHLSRGDAEADRRAFAAAERAKSRTLVDLLTGLIPPAPATSDDPELAARLASLQADLSAAYTRLMEATGEGDWEGWRSRATRLEGEINQLRLRLSGPVAESDRFASPLSLEALEAQLPRDLPLLAYHTVGDEILAFVFRRGELHLAREVSRVPVVQSLLQRLNAQWDRFRAGRDFAQRHMSQLEKTAQRVLAALYAELVAPVEPWLEARAADRLAVVPHGLLHRVPFHALFDGQQYLLDRYAISYAPSATVLALCQPRARHEPRRALLVAVPDALIPGARGEAEAVAHELTKARVQTETLTDARATLAALNALEPGCDVLHLACHGLFRADNPMFSALKLHDGWLTAADAMRLNLRDSLVTLSACESGRATVASGDEVIGLPRALLGAGAASVVVSLWLVSDATTVMLMKHWYRQWREGADRGEALQAAQREVRQCFPHPYYWAPFVLMGGR